MTKDTLFSDSPLAKRLLEISPAAILIVNEQGKILLINGRLSQWLGFSAAEIVGHSIGELLPNTPMCDLMAGQACSLSHQSSATDRQIQPTLVRNRSGQSVSACVSVHPFESPTGEIVVIHLVPRNVDVELLQSERLAAIAKMISGLAHESRNSLQSAVASLDLLELDFQNNDEQLELSTRIRESLAELLARYDDVRRYAEPIRLRLRAVNLLDLFQTVFNEIVLERDRVDDAVTFQVRLGGEAVAAVDREKMKIVFRHLIENAIDASGDITRIDVECLRNVDHGIETIHLKVRDQGNGMHSSQIERIFEPFFTTKQRGTGLGLAVCRRIIEAHGGQIYAAGQRQSGACIELWLPVDTKSGRNEDSASDAK